ncbi:hypothetical protein C7S18_15090 [Ahniella affigens]|uniref:Sulfatase N-terminal domain-containing protein n=1 Tax=Ahniella affigens TaxID=2021234 RepID=A0A2P1PUD8_9GAMM|nr:sulfatase [Ahniella affigens]AVP98432.1 hypothetical protein C7S18_15090 [Ahniella affigens]
MKRPHLPIALFVSLGLVACSKTPETPTARLATQPDVVMVTLDTTRRDVMGCYGNAAASRTPAFDALCAAGLRFDQAVAVAPVTLPAHASIMSGQYPGRHGARYNGLFQLSEGITTLAEQLKASGYRTEAYVSAMVLEHRFGVAQGFDHYDDTLKQSDSGLSGSNAERASVATMDAALAGLGKVDRKQPVFLWVHLFDAHAPYVGIRDGLSERDAYLQEVATDDAQLQRLQQAIEARARPTVWWVLADHGESLGEHGERTHGLFVYDATVHIPMLLVAPGVAPAVRADLVSQVDILPTTLALVGAPGLPNLDGRDVLAGQRQGTETVISETALPWFDFGLAPLYALRNPGHKYIAAPKPEFFDLGADPGEASNLVVDGKLTGQAADWSVQVDGYVLEFGEIEAAKAAQHSANAADLERLKSLGYLSGSDMGLGRMDPKDAVDLVSGHSKAVELASVGQTDAALLLLDQVLSRFPTARGALFLRARLLAASGQYVAAEADIKQVNAAQPDADSVLLAAQLSLLLKRADDARLLLDQARHLDPNHGGVLIVLGDLALQAKQVDVARDYYEQALALDSMRIGRQARMRLARLPTSASLPKSE